jgi:amidohydrolase
MNDQQLIEVIKEIVPEVISLRHLFHKNPEVAFKELRTSRTICEYLNNRGLQYEVMAETAVVSNFIVDSSFPTLAIRAEMDALAVEDGTCCEYSSINKGVSHACGHDGIMAIVLGIAGLLPKLKERLQSNIKFIFQPAEEIGQGAKALIARGVLRNPEVDKVLILHLSNLTPGGLLLQMGFATAATGTLVITVHGRSGHWSRVSEGKNAIYIAAEVVMEIERINQTLTSPQPFIVGAGTMHSGIKSNIIPDLAEIKCTLRACSRDEQYRIYQSIQERIRNIENKNETSIETEFIPGPPSLTNDPKMLEEAMIAGEEIFGPEHVVLADEMPLIGDDAAYYFEEVPGIKLVFCGPLKNDINYPAHNPRFNFDENIMPLAIHKILKLITDGGDSIA